YDILLTKLDSNLDVVWHKQYNPSYMYDAGWKLLIEPDGYLVAGGRNNIGIVQKNFSIRALLMKTDTDGNVLWEWQSAPLKKTYDAKDVIRTRDGGYVYCGQGDGYEYLWPNGTTSTPEFRGW